MDHDSDRHLDRSGFAFVMLKAAGALHPPLRLRASRDPLAVRDVAKNPGWTGRGEVPFAAPEAGALELAPGICHVRHRTALLSQLVTRQGARLDVRGSVVGGRGRRRTAATTSSQRPEAARRLPPRRVDRPRAQEETNLCGVGCAGTSTGIVRGFRGGTRVRQ
jgi:hypothetical protein